MVGERIYVNTERDILLKILAGTEGQTIQPTLGLSWQNVPPAAGPEQVPGNGTTRCPSCDWDGGDILTVAIIAVHPELIFCPAPGQVLYARLSFRFKINLEGRFYFSLILQKRKLRLM